MWDACVMCVRLAERKRCDVCGKGLFSSISRHKKLVHRDWVHLGPHLSAFVYIVLTARGMKEVRKRHRYAPFFH
jgi:hypothetical protein